MQTHYPITCPHCWQTFEVPLDCSAGNQSIIYDCEVCCNPLEIEYAVDGTEVVSCNVTNVQ